MGDVDAGRAVPHRGWRRAAGVGLGTLLPVTAGSALTLLSSARVADCFRDAVGCSTAPTWPFPYLFFGGAAAGVLALWLPDRPAADRLRPVLVAVQFLAQAGVFLVMAAQT